jgi:hypothetical protein
MLLVMMLCMICVSTSKAQDQLGAVNSVSNPTCPTTGLQGADCYTLTVDCPSIPGVQIKLKLFPAISPIGLAILGTGGLGNNYWEAVPYGKTTIKALQSAHFKVVETLFVHGWQPNSNGLGLRKASCRYTTTVKWIKQHLAPTVPVCSAGISAGGAVIGYGLSHFAIDRYIKYALLASGPPFSRVDYACDDSQPHKIEYCSNADAGMGVGIIAAQKFLDPAYSPTFTAACSTVEQNDSTELDYMFLSNSINSTDADLNYLVTVEFMYGSLDKSSAINQGEYYRSSILSPTLGSCILDTPHAIANSLAGARAVADELVLNCK